MSSKKKHEKAGGSYINVDYDLHVGVRFNVCLL